MSLKLEKKILEVINKISSKSWLVADVVGPTNAKTLEEGLRRMPLESIQDITKICTQLGFNPAVEYELYQWASDIVESKENKNALRKKRALVNDWSNRGKYLPQGIWKYYRGFRKGTGEPFERFQTSGDALPRNEESDSSGTIGDLRCAGLMVNTIEYLAHKQGKEITEPIAIGFVNQLPLDSDGIQPPIPSSAWDRVNEAGIVVSGGRVGWNMNTPAWGWLAKMFPQYIDCRAYNHSLNAPVLPDGFIPECKLVLGVLRSDGGIDLETDGSGIYHVDCPAIQAFIARYGLVPIQFRYINEQGVFVKGALFPSTRSLDANGRPCITCDWIQVKGVMKALAKIRREENAQAEIEGYMGFIQVWRKPSKNSGSFEFLENIKKNSRTIEIIEGLAGSAMDELADGGIDKLLVRLAQVDPRIKTMLQLITAMVSRGIKIKAAQIPQIREALKDALAKRLWIIASSAAINGDRYVCRLDATIPAGYAVVSGIPVGKKVGAFRLPLLGPQGLVSLEICEAPAHLLVDGKMPPFQIVMNPRDLTLRMQGDDDGDTAGVITNPEVLELFDHLIDDRVFHIEPPKGKRGVSLNIATDSPEGIRRMRGNPQGPGIFTLIRSRLIAVEDFMGGVAMSLIIQQSVDQAKRQPEWLDYRLAADIANWKQHPNGDYYFDIPMPKDKLVDGNLDEKDYYKWQHERCSAFAGIHPKKILSWRKNAKKRIDIDNWKTTQKMSGWKGGNLVHIAHDTSCLTWETTSKNFKFNKEKIEPEVLLPALFAELPGVKVYHPTWKQYMYDLRVKSGLRKFTKALAILVDNKTSDSDYYYQIDKLHDELHESLMELTLNEILTIWWAELHYQMGNDNNAFRAIAWKNSPIMKLLGVVSEEDCNFLSEEDRLPRIMRALETVPDPQKKLATIIFNSTLHGDLMKDANGEDIPGSECQCCCDRLGTALVRNIRAKHQLGMLSWLKTSTSRFNGTYKEPVEEAPILTPPPQAEY